MSQCILMIHDADRVWYLMWSTVVDAPVTRGMSLDELRDYIREEEGANGLRRLPERLLRCAMSGASWTSGKDLESTIACNRAGPAETRLTLKEIVETYCRPPAEGKECR